MNIHADTCLFADSDAPPTISVCLRNDFCAHTAAKLKLRHRSGQDDRLRGGKNKSEETTRRIVRTSSAWGGWGGGVWKREMSSEGMEWNKSALKRRQLAKHHAFSFEVGYVYRQSASTQTHAFLLSAKRKSPENCQQSIIVWCVCDICCPFPSIPINLLAAMAVGFKNTAGTHLSCPRQ